MGTAIFQTMIWAKVLGFVIFVAAGIWLIVRAMKKY